MQVLLIVGLVNLLSCETPPTDPVEPLPDLPERVETLTERGEELPLREISIAFVGELRGEIEPCGCPTLPYGGFARRQSLLQRLEAEMARPLLHVDVGEALRKGLVHDPDGDTKERAELILELMSLSGVQAYVPGPTDLATVGVEGLKRSGLPVISATWEPFPATIVLEEQGLRVGLIGLSAKAAGVEGLDPVEATRAALAELPEVDVTIALSNLGDTENLRVAEEVSGLGLILATRGSSHDAPRNLGQCAVIEVPDRGRYVELAHLWLMSGSDQPVLVDEDFHTDFVQYDESRRARARTGRETPEEGEKALRSVLEELGRGRNLVSVEERPLGSELDDPSEVSERLDVWRQLRMTQARAAVAAEPVEYSPAYATAAGCTSCHARQFARFGFTEHRNAGTTLTKDGRHTDPECLGCHTTGFGLAGGFADTDPISMRKWGGVQCESCHGPLAGHPREPRAVPAQVDESTCLRCHDEANSPNFDYSTYLLDVICPTG